MVCSSFGHNVVIIHNKKMRGNGRKRERKCSKMVTVTSRFSCLLLLKVVPCSLAKQRKAQVQELTSFPPDQEGRANLTTVYRIGIHFFHSNVITGYHLNYAAAAQCGCNNESS